MYLYRIKTFVSLILVGICCTIFPLVLIGQIDQDKIFIKHFDIESGISQCVITDMVEDKQGFIWLSTYDGLNRFDGYEFKIFRSNPNDENSLPTPKVNKLFYDHNKTLWLYTPMGVTPFNIETGKAIKNDILKKYEFTHVCRNDPSTIWAYDKNNVLHRLNDKLDITFSSTPNSLIPKGTDLLEIIKIGNQIFAISQTGQIYSYTIKSNSWKHYVNPLHKKGIQYSCIAYDEKERLYLGSMYEDLIEFNINTKTYEYSLANTLNRQLIGVNDFHYDNQSNSLLIATYGQGLFNYNLSRKEIIQYKKGNTKLNINSNYVLSIIKDRQNAIWLGYDGRGLDVLDPNIKKFIALQKESPLEQFNLKFVRKIVETKKGKLWFATAGSGLIEYDQTIKEFKFYNTAALFPKAENFIIEMVKVRNQLWLGLNGGGLAIFDLHRKKVIKTIQAGDGEDEINYNSIWSFNYDTQNDLVWIGFPEKGLCAVNSNTFEVKKYYDPTNAIFDDNGMRTMYRTRSNRFIVGTTKGLLEYKPNSDQFIQVYPDANEEIKNIHSIKCIYEDETSRLWTGSDGSGIAVLDKNYKLLKTFNTKDGLSNDVIYGILPENKNSYWISSNQGLSNIIWNENVFSQNENIAVMNYNVQSGLQGNEFNTNSYLKLKDGSLAFGGTAGVNIFKGEIIKQGSKIPEVIITDFSVFNNMNISEIQTPYLNSVNLRYNQNSFSLKYNTVGYTLVDKIKYQYRLLGYNDKWVDADKRTYVSYTNLDYGLYEFQVKASNYDGLWGNEYTTFEIEIQAPLYKKWWFIAASLLTTALIIWMIYRYQSNQRKIREEMKMQYTKEIAEVEMKALRAQINPHFLFNSLNSINNFILKNDNVNARKYLVKFSQLVRNILNNSTASFISLKEELDTIKLYVQIESMRFDNQFNFKLDVDEDIKINEIKIPSLLLQPYIENAIWHGLMHKTGQKKIEIHISRKSEELIKIEIEDNGIGRKAAEVLTPKEKRRKSYGMQLGENRLKLMSSEHQGKGQVAVTDLFDQNDTACGTLIAITLPVINK